MNVIAISGFIENHIKNKTSIITNASLKQK